MLKSTLKRDTSDDTAKSGYQNMNYLGLMACMIGKRKIGKINLTGGYGIDIKMTIILNIFLIPNILFFYFAC